VKIVGTKSLMPRKGLQRRMEVRGDERHPLLGGIIASFAGSEIEQKLEKEFKVLKSMA